jgi:hypothetical protein
MNARPEFFTVTAGEEFPGVDFTIAPGALCTISGKVEPASPSGNFWLALTPPDQPALAVAVTVAEADGRFHFHGMPLGAYHLFASGPSTARGRGGILGAAPATRSYDRRPRPLLAARPGTRVVSRASGRPSMGASQVKVVTLVGGQQLDRVDFYLHAYGEISGKVLEENKEPIPGMTVFFVAREYATGALRYVFAAMARTDDRGEYRLQNVQPGRGYLILAEKQRQRIEAVSDVPSDLKSRKTVPTPTYYPGALGIDGAQAIVLRAGERRQGVDIQLLRGPSYCVEGVLEADGRPTLLFFSIRELQPASGPSGNGAVFVTSPHGESGQDGKIRICDLHSGDYQITATQLPKDTGPPPFFGTASVTITDRDVRNVRIGAGSRVSIPGEAVWYGTPPEKPVESKISLWLRPITRAPWQGELVDAEASIPGEFSFPALLIDDYNMNVSHVPEGTYLKDVTYGGISILHEPFRPGSVMGNAGLRLIVARDGGTINTKVTDKDGNPVADCQVLIVPRGASSESSVADSLLLGQTDQNGPYSSAMLAPGKYFVLATSAAVDKTRKHSADHENPVTCPGD